MKLTDWSAKRAGAKITITGTDENGRAVKIVGVDSIAARKGGGAVAVDMSNETHELA